ncbi:MAG: hypothetical protein HYU86_04915 [Chloroflexi bacterium]|nr:hypothetical protein [Chloroflexota bacterium]
MSRLVVDYILFVFVSACGVLQIVAARARLGRLLFFKSWLPSYALGAMAVAVAFGWFFNSDNRAIPGLGGTEQFYGFVAAFFLALVFTLLLSSLLRIRGVTACQQRNGLDALRDRTYLQAIGRLWRERGE